MLETCPTCGEQYAPQPGINGCPHCQDTEEVGEDWDGIDDGWELVDLGDGKKRRRRTRAKGKKKGRAPAQNAPQAQNAAQKQKPKVKKPRPPREATSEKKKKEKERPAWLLPVVVFLLAVGVLVLAFVASES